jgi:hypothetical protein
MVKHLRFRGKKMRERREDKYEDSHLESQGDGRQPFSAPLLSKCLKRMREAVH